MKVLLVVSPSFSLKMLQEEIDSLRTGRRDFTRSVDWRPAPPLGILYIAAALRRAGHDVHIHDLHRAFYACREKGYFADKDLPDFFEAHFESVLKRGGFDVVGISCLFNVSWSSVEEMARRSKRTIPGITTVIGGHYPTAMCCDVLATGVVDYVILGEAEDEFVRLLDRMAAGSTAAGPHTATAADHESDTKEAAIIDNPDTLAVPAWDLLPHVRDYVGNSIDAERVGSGEVQGGARSAAVMTTRGCPMGCTFCAAHGVHGRVVRAHSIGYMMDHIDRLVADYDVDNLLIQDDMFNFSAPRAIEFCRVLCERYPGRFRLEFPNGLAVWKLNEELVVSLKEAGLRSITVAVESGSPYVQRHILKKNLNLDLVKEKVALLKRHGVGIRAFYIVGFVGETLEMMQETVRFALDLNIDWSEFKVFTPLVGSEMYDIARGRNCLTGDMSEHVYGRACVRTDDFTPEQVKTVQYDANIRVNFLASRYLKEERYDTAERVFGGLLKRFPNHLFAQWALWQALDGQHKEGEAQKALARLQALADESQANGDLLSKYDIQLPVVTT